MKYIRTENEICELDDNWALFCQEYANNKQADTIEELCDEFVYEYQTGIRVINKKIIAMPDIVKTYGAIWTDKGLIYVAKVNKKGELELL